MKTSVTQTDRLDELQTLVAQLGSTLAASERRTARLERVLRWGALTGLSILAITLAVTLKPLDEAVASTESPSVKLFAKALDDFKQGLGQNDNLARFLDDLAALTHNLRVLTDDAGMMMQSAWGDALEQARVETGIVAQQVTDCQSIQDPSNASVQSLRASYPLGVFSAGYFCTRPEHPLSPPQSADLEPVQFAEPLLKAGSNALVDVGIVLTRVRQDSNAFRQWLASGGGERALGQISGELHFLNASIAAMVRDMSVMSYSVGSTMGRAGSWMPW